jgi:hypothetical protein
MKLADLKKGYADAKAIATGAREVLGTETRNVVSAGTTSEGFPYVMVDQPIKVHYDGEWRMVNRVVLFNEDLDIFKGTYATNAEIIHLNGLKASAKIDIFAYENEEGEANISHSVKISLDAKNTASLIAKAQRSATAPSPAVAQAQNVFE